MQNSKSVKWDAAHSIQRKGSAPCSRSVERPPFHGCADSFPGVPITPQPQRSFLCLRPAKKCWPCCGTCRRGLIFGRSPWRKRIGGPSSRATLLTPASPIFVLYALMCCRSAPFRCPGGYYCWAFFFRDFRGWIGEMKRQLKRGCPRVSLCFTIHS